MVSWSVRRERGPAHTSSSDFWPPELQEDASLLFSATYFVVVCEQQPQDTIISGKDHTSRTGLRQVLAQVFACPSSEDT